MPSVAIFTSALMNLCSVCNFALDVLVCVHSSAPVFSSTLLHTSGSVCAGDVCGCVNVCVCGCVCVHMCSVVWMCVCDLTSMERFLKYMWPQVDNTVTDSWSLKML